MKKLVTILLITVIVFNFIFCGSAYADLDDVMNDMSRYGGNSVLQSSVARNLAEEGKDSTGLTMVYPNMGSSFIPIVFQTIAMIMNSFAMVAQGVISLFTAAPGTSGEVEFTTAIASLFSFSTEHFTIEKTVYNEVPIFNINVFEQGSTYTNSPGSVYQKTFNQSNLNLDLKKSVTSWFYIMRLLATMINLCVLIFIGIKMAMTSVATEEAKYKKMLIWWAESLIVLFLLHYIIYIILYLGDFILNIINRMRLSNPNNVSFEQHIVTEIHTMLLSSQGMKFFLYSLFFWFLTGLHLKFFMTYLKRTFTVMFLIVVSPLITITFPIDKLDNGKAEAFEQWLKRMVINAIIQPIHAVVYLVFVFLAGEIAVKAPVVGMAFLLSLGRVENIIRNVFRITDAVDNVNAAVKGGKGPGIAGFMRMFAEKPGGGS